MFDIINFVSVSNNHIMSVLKKIPDKGDPSDILQIFPKYNLQLLCCRHWWLQKWEFLELSFPYWRIYHNSQSGAVIIYEGKEYELTPDKIIMIAPNTSYATKLYDHTIPKTGYSFKGGRVNSAIEENEIHKNKYILHLFIYFNIGNPYDSVSPGIFVFYINDHLQKKLQIIKNSINNEHSYFSFYSNLTIQSLINDLLMELPESNWNLTTTTYRILNVLNHIDNNLNSSITNPNLAKKAGLATNAFIKLFTEETGVSPQKYVKNKRIDKACILLHHSNFTIDEVAAKTGFADRYHFSRIFKNLTGVSPARYKKEFGIKQ